LALARLVVQHQNLAKRRNVLALLSHGYLAYSVASDEKLLETSRVALGRVVPRRRANARQQRARGEEARNARSRNVVCALKILENLIQDVFLVVDHT